MSRPLFENLAEIGSRISLAPHILLFLDFDGTLTPIVEHLSMAHLSSEMREILVRLSRRNNISLAFISGRALNDVQARISVEGAIYAGNHGLEISGPGLYFVEPTAQAQQEALQRLSDHLTTRLRHIACVEVENKGLTASIHFRRAAKGDWDEIEQIVRTAVTTENHKFLLTTGKRVYEIRPQANWHKGSAVRWIREQLAKENAVVICLGDDVTDENAFAAIADGITIKVGNSAQTVADYCIADPHAVREFLLWLAETVNAVA